MNAWFEKARCWKHSIKTLLQAIQIELLRPKTPVKAEALQPFNFERSFQNFCLFFIDWKPKRNLQPGQRSRPCFSQRTVYMWRVLCGSLKWKSPLLFLCNSSHVGYYVFASFPPLLPPLPSPFFHRSLMSARSIDYRYLKNLMFSSRLVR